MTYNIIKGGVSMTHFSGPYYVYNGELYRKVKMTQKGYHLRNKKNKLVWITMKKIMEIINNK